MNTKNFFVGDWVKAKSFEGEIVIGYVEHVNELNKSLRIKAVQAEQDGVKGRSIETRVQSVSALPVYFKKSKADLLGLIDLALLTGDKEWFKELTKELQKFAAEPVGNEPPGDISSSNSRLGIPHTR
ncbi:MAG: IDEAL domain-containing protein [Bacillota bacterium]